MDIREMGFDGVDWIDLAQDRDRWRALVYTVMSLRVPYNAENFLSRCTVGSFSRRAQLHELDKEWEVNDSKHSHKLISSSLFPNKILISYYRSKISQQCHIFEKSIRYIYIIILYCILVTRHEYKQFVRSKDSVQA
jgi:hypothetical protein